MSLFGEGSSLGEEHDALDFESLQNGTFTNKRLDKTQWLLWIPIATPAMTVTISGELVVMGPESGSHSGLFVSAHQTSVLQALS